MFACKGGHLDTVFTLLQHNVNTVIRNRVSHITIHVDSVFKLSELMIYIYIRLCSKEGMTAADVASINEHPEVYGTLELMAPQTEDLSEVVEVSSKLIRFDVSP